MVPPPRPPSDESPLESSSSLLLRIILGGDDDDNDRDRSLKNAIGTLSTYDLLIESDVLDDAARRGKMTNLYHRVRALLFLHAIHRYHLPERRRGPMTTTRWGTNDDDGDGGTGGHRGDEEDGNSGTTAADDVEFAFCCPDGHAALLDRRFDEAIDNFLASVSNSPMTVAIFPDVEGDDDGDAMAGCRDGGGEGPHRTSLVSRLVYSSTSDRVTTNTTSSDVVASATDERRRRAPRRATTTATSSTTSTSSSPSTMPALLPSDATSSALARAYRELAFQTLADQVRDSVKSHPGNGWMFEERGGGGGGGGVCEELTPLRWSADLLPNAVSPMTAGPTLCERTPVRMDLSHSCWSDIFFLAMDNPEVARVVNLSVDLAVSSQRGGNGTNDVGDVVRPVPPIECRLCLTTTNPGTIRLTSMDLKSTVLLTHASQVFDYGSDHLGLLRAGLVASGIVPLGLEGRCRRGRRRADEDEDDVGDDVPLGDLLSVMMPTSVAFDGGGCPYGLELVTNVRDIPKGSRLAVSTNLLGSMIALGMRATGQTSSLIGPLLEEERRLVAARAILGEWLGGSGGGWQDSGGVWPGLKLIHGVRSTEGDPEYGVSRGRLLPRHRLLTEEDAPESLLRELGKSLVLIHGE